MAHGQNESSGIRFPPPLLFILAIGLGYVIQRAIPIALAPAALTPALRPLGALLVVAGLALDAAALLAFRRAGTRPEPWKPASALSATGPYRFTRNPMYLGSALAAGGAAALMNSLWAFALLVPAVGVVNRLVIRREERYLESRFGAEYLAYKARVRRWL